MGSYYMHSNGNRFDRSILEKAEQLTSGQGDGRISKDDAGPLAKTVNDANVRTDVEDRTVRKLYRDFNFTDAGRREFSSLNRSAGQRRRAVASQLAIRSQS